ncbi:MAG: gamma-glutamyltransferase [Candidatus Zixiibacteriota bacterium]|nr:MAG: gamma-glutamyltransferase [candidate division Zixibacteria bacterium]
MVMSGSYSTRALSLPVSVMVLAALCLGCANVEVTQYHDRGALATAAPIATAVGEGVFAEGGNAFDVAVAVGFTLAVVHPQAGNIGGGGFAVVRDGSSGAIEALDFREKAPSAAHETMYQDSTGQVIEGLSTVGALASGVPGTVAGLYELWSRHGSLAWEELVGVAASLADTGFVVDDYLARSLNDYKLELTEFEPTARQFFPDGRQWQAGDRLIQSDLAKTLYSIAAGGKDGFYTGTVAEYIEQTMASFGGVITAEDLLAYEVIWRDPIHFRFDSLDIYSMPPPSSGGVHLGQILKLLEPYDFSRFTANSPGYIHLFCEASRLAFADRSEHLADPDFHDVPVARLLDGDYIALRRALISPEHASSSGEVGPGLTASPESDQTTHYSVCDRDGNMVAVTYTLNASYGSKLVVEGAGFLLNNEMDDFSVKPGVPNLYGLVGAAANRIEPNKRMLSSMSPTLVMCHDRPMLVLGAPGGGKIITVVAQAILNFTRFKMSPLETVRQPRVHHQWLPDVLYLEQGQFSIDVKQTLIRYGHTIEERDPYSDLQLLHIETDGLMTGASDPRGRGTVGGY